MILDHSPFLDSKISTLPEHVVYYNDDPYGPQRDAMSLRQFRPIGINRTSQTALLQMCPNKSSETTGIQWLVLLQSLKIKRALSELLIS